MCEDESQGAEWASLPLQLCGREELKKQNKTGLTDTYLIWMLCNGTRGMSGQMVWRGILHVIAHYCNVHMKRILNRREEMRKLGGGDHIDYTLFWCRFRKMTALCASHEGKSLAWCYSSALILYFWRWKVIVRYMKSQTFQILSSATSLEMKSEFLLGRWQLRARHPRWLLRASAATKSCTVHCELATLVC